MLPAFEVRPCTEPATFCFSVHADDDVSVLPRVTGILAKRSLRPARMIATRFQQNGGELHIDFQIESLDHPTAELIAKEMRRMVTSRVVLISEK